MAEQLCRAKVEVEFQWANTGSGASSGREHEPWHRLGNTRCSGRAGHARWWLQLVGQAGSWGDGLERYCKVRAERPRKAWWGARPGKVISLAKLEWACPSSDGLGAGPEQDMWQQLAGRVLAALPSLFLHQETRFPVTQTHESAFPLSIIHSKRRKSAELGGLEERKEYSMT